MSAGSHGDCMMEGEYAMRLNKLYENWVYYRIAENIGRGKICIVYQILVHQIMIAGCNNFVDCTC